MIVCRTLQYVFFCLIISTTIQAIAQTQREATGYNQLAAEVGPTLETGSGVAVGQVEGLSGNAYLPDTTNSQFSGKTFFDGSGTNVGTSNHATIVGAVQYGSVTSLSPGVTNITGYEANDWIFRILGTTNKTAPLQQNFAVMNHSYIGNGLSEVLATEISHRMDFLINRDNIVMAVGANNGAASAVPQLWSHTYNALTVGLTDGTHSHGTTAFNGPGRIKPDIVAPHGTAPDNSFTSYSTPVVAAAATVIYELGMKSGNSNAIQNEITKAILLTGATKGDVASWNNSPTQPLDATFGAGQLNIYNSYKIMEGGEFNGSATEPAMSAGNLGWDYDDSHGAGQTSYYNVDLSGLQNEATVTLTWNAEISDSGGILDYDTLTLANLDLKLYNSTGTFMNSLLAESISTVDNVEHLYLTNLAAGRYTISVEGISGTTDYGLGWQFVAVPEPSVAGMVILVGCLLRRRARV